MNSWEPSKMPKAVLRPLTPGTGNFSGKQETEESDWTWHPECRPHFFLTSHPKWVLIPTAICCSDNTMTKSNLERRGLQLTGYSLSPPREVSTAVQGETLKKQTKVKSTTYWSAARLKGLLLPKAITATPTSVREMKKTYWRSVLQRHFFSWGSCFPGVPGWQD